MSNPKVPHPHKEMLIAYANGEQIQMRSIDGVWVDLKEPAFSLNVTYRIKPEPRPDIVVYRTASLGEWGEFELDADEFSANLKLTFDGDSRKLKSVEVLK